MRHSNVFIKLRKAIDKLTDNFQEVGSCLLIFFSVSIEPGFMVVVFEVGEEVEGLFVDHVLSNWSYQQIADHLGVSHSAVESRLHRARKRMRAELAAMEVIEVS